MSPVSLRCVEEAEREEIAESIEEVRGMLLSWNDLTLVATVGLELTVELAPDAVVTTDSKDRVRSRSVLCVLLAFSLSETLSLLSRRGCKAAVLSELWSPFRATCCSVEPACAASGEV